MADVDESLEVVEVTSVALVDAIRACLSRTPRQPSHSAKKW